MELRKFFRSDLAGLNPYHVEQPDHCVKLDANESPFGLPKGILKEILKEIGKLNFHRYPDPRADRLRTAISEMINVDKDLIVVGNGSDELISYIFQIFAKPDVQALFPSPTFSMYRIFAQICGIPFTEIPLGSNFELIDETWQSCLDQYIKNLVFLAYPNNPTGNLFSEDILHKILSRSDTILILDEAYCEFSGKSLLSRVHQHPNLIVTRTFSKAYGLAGIRCGYLVAHPDIVSEVNKVRMPYNLNSFSQTVAMLMIKYRENLRLHIKSILEERKRVYDRLVKIDWCQPTPTDSNFILFRTRKPANLVFHKVLSHGVLIRNLNRPGLLEDCLRVTIGTTEENNQFLNAITDDFGEQV
tara:strand:- start:324 stop:1397 length:1074 start_codon:yes stop_codon:yes gene_type:complete